MPAKALLLGTGRRGTPSCPSRGIRNTKLWGTSCPSGVLGEGTRPACKVCPSRGMPERGSWSCRELSWCIFPGHGTDDGTTMGVGVVGWGQSTEIGTSTARQRRVLPSGGARSTRRRAEGRSSRVCPRVVLCCRSRQATPGSKPWWASPFQGSNLAATECCRDGWCVVWAMAAKPSNGPFPSGNLAMEGVLA